MNEATLAFAAGFGLGGALVYLLLYRRLARAEAELSALRESHRLTEEAKDALVKTFELLTKKNVEAASEKLAQEAGELFSRLGLELKAHSAEIEGLLGPLDKTLRALEARVLELERARQGAYGELLAQIELLREEQRRLAEAANSLSSALSAEGTRGEWGELELRRLVELAGMNEHVDFELEPHTSRGRPDLVVYLPGGGKIAVDAKAPMKAFLKAQRANDERERKRLLKEHARALRERIRDLAKKRYWEGLGDSPELVVAFVPSEAALHAAFAADPDLFEEALRLKVLPAGPATLLALLKSVAFGWQRQRLSEEARRLAEEAGVLFRELGEFSGHLGEVGRRLGKSVEAYNKAVAELERRINPLLGRMARRMGNEAPPPPDPIGQTPWNYGEGESSK